MWLWLLPICMSAFFFFLRLCHVLPFPKLQTRAWPTLANRLLTTVIAAGTLRSLAYLWEFFLLFLGSLTLETRMMYVDVYVCAYSCDGRPGLATGHGTGRGLSHVPPCFQTVSAVHHCMYWATWPVFSRYFPLSTSHLALGTLGLQAHCSVRLLHGFRSVKRSPPPPAPTPCLPSKYFPHWAISPVSRSDFCW